MTEQQYSKSTEQETVTSTDEAQTSAPAESAAEQQERADSGEPAEGTGSSER